MKKRPDSYDDFLSILADLPVIVRETRRRKQQSQREAAKQIGVSFTTISRIESGEHDIQTSVLRPVIEWLKS